MLAAGMTDYRLEQLAFIKRADDCGDHVHELEVLPFHIAGEQALGVGRESKKQSKIVTRSYDGPTKLHRTIVEWDLFAWASSRISATTLWSVAMTSED